MPYYDPYYIQDYSTMMLTQEVYSPQKSSCRPQVVRRRKRKNNLPDIDHHVQEVLRLIKDGFLNYIHQTAKNANALTIDNCRRRSQYTGVSRNGRNWQVLVNMGKNKKYIGSYTSEKEAAIAYDFYTICLHKTKAKTNFSYHSSTIEQMIESYKLNEKVLDPTLFVNAVSYN